MRPERLSDPRRFLSFDLETHRVQPGLIAPPVVCGSAAVVGADGRPVGRLLDKVQARAVFRRALADASVVLVGANIAYDCLCMAVDAVALGEDLMPAIFDMFDAGRVFDVQLAEALHGVGIGTLGRDPRDGAPLLKPDGKPGWYSLQNVTSIRTGRDSAKVHDLYRESYALLDGTPIDEWPEVARVYPVDDACNTLEDALIQVGALPAGAGGVAGPCFNLHDLSAQVGSAWALHLGAAWGFNVDPETIRVLDERTARTRAEGAGEFVTARILRPDGTQDLARTKLLVAQAYGCSGQCVWCMGTGKIPSAKTGKPVQCKQCGATGLDITSAPVPTSDGSQCARCPACKSGNGKECEARVPGISYSRDTLAESGDETLMHYAAYSEDAKIQSTYLPWLRSGLTEDGRRLPLVLRPKAILETGRVSYGDVVQLLPRNGGIRECVVPRPGYTFGSVDYEGGELVTHGQSCLWIVGWSKMADALRAGTKVHDALGATLAGISYDEMLKRGKEFKQYRQAAKPANFGFPGGMGAVKLVLQQRKNGPDTVGPDGRKYKGLRFCILTGGAAECGTIKVTEWKGRPNPPTCQACIECAERVRAAWFAQWPENRPYFEYVAEQSDGPGYVLQHLSRRRRGGGNFTSYANGYFQALLADIAKGALRRASRECYVRGQGESALYGSRIILFAHDEIVAEHPTSIAAEACTRLSEIMVEEFKAGCPDLTVACKAAPTLMNRWYKGAEPAYKDGRLVAWEPKQ